MAETTSGGAPGPGPEHQVLQKDVGAWDARVEIRGAPGSPPQVLEGVAHNRLACAGLWLVCDFLVEASGFEGHGLYGYDPGCGKYVGTWVDSTRPFLAVSEGSWDAASRTMTLWTEARLPDGRTISWRETTETRDADTRVWRSLFPAPGGGETEVMTVTYRRRA